MNRNTDSPTEKLGLVALGSAGRWHVDVDELVEATGWLLEIDGPGAYIVLQLDELEVLPRALRFLQDGLSMHIYKNRDGHQAEREIHLGQFGSSAVTLHWDNEDFPRCFLIIGAEPHGTLRLSLGAEDIRLFCDALDQVVKELPLSGGE